MANEFKHDSVGSQLSQTEYEAVGGHVLDSQAAGDIIYASSTSQLSRLGIGTAGQVLITNSGASAPEWSAALTGVTSIYATDLILGEDSQTAIDFGTVNEIDFKVDNAARLTLTTGALYPVTNNQIDLGTSSLEFKDAFFDGTVTADAFAGPLTGTASTATVATTVTITDNESTNESNAIIFTAGGDVDGGNLGLESDGTLTYNPSTGKITATGFIGALTGDVTGNVSGTAATVTTAAQTNITSLGTLTTLTVDNIIINGTNIGHTSDTDSIAIASDGVVTMNQIPVFSAGINVSGGSIAGTLSTAAQTNITSLGTLTALTVDDVAVNGKVVTMTGSASDTAVFTAGTHGTLSIVTTDAAAAAANIQITADGTVDIDSAGVLTLDSGAAINIEPASGSAILLDGTISIDAGVVTGATSITSTAFVGDITGDVTGNASGTALTVTQAAQSSITSLGTLTTLTVDNVIVNGTTIGHTSDTDLMTLADGALTLAGTLNASGDIEVADGKVINLDSTQTDNNFSGTTAEFANATGSTIDKGKIVYLTGTATQVALARANADSTMPGFALAIADVANGASGKFLLHGIVHDSDILDLTIGGEVYVSEDTAGAMTKTLPASSGDRVQVVGIGLHADKMLFNPSYDIVERG
tara:strand:- start:253 stop:2184 length:1932 start_codon:yes stop_codon:yes gene_type:complete